MMILSEIKEYLEEQAAITGAAYLLFDEEGRLLFETKEVKVNDAKIKEFLQSDNTEKTQKEQYLSKVRLGEMLLVLFVLSEESSAIYGKTATSAIRHISKASDPDSSEEGIFRKVLLEEPNETVYRKAIEKGMKPEAVRTVYLVSFEGEIPESVDEILKNISPEAEKDQVIPLDLKTIAYLRTGRGAKEEKELQKFGEEALAMINMELLTNAHISYGTSTTSMKELHRSYEEAYMAMEVAKIFYEERRLSSYSRLGIGRLIYELPEDLCVLFLKEIFGEKRLYQLEEEELTLIDRFFANNLNISETARDLFLHRNTLVYRLEKLQKHTGLDIRKFEDAMTLKLGMLVSRFLQVREKD